MAITKMKVDRDLCIGAAPCVFAAESVFELDGENKAVMKLKDEVKTSEMTEKAKLEDDAVADDMLMAAAQACPVKAVFLYDENDKQVYPA
ncbi:ferredoxin [Patescibacteria group bacterium]